MFWKRICDTPVKLHKIQKLAPNRLTVDPAVQRRLDKSRVTEMAAKFDPMAMGVLTVSAREDGALVVLDGQHRMQAAIEAGRGTVSTDCCVWHGLTLAEEAAMFRRLNTAVRPRPTDLFLIRLVEGEPVAVSIEGIAQHHGWKIASGTGVGLLSCVVSLEKVWKLDRGAIGLLDTTLNVVTAAWGHEPDAGNSALILGTGQLIFRHFDVIDLQTLVNKMSKLGTPAGVLGKAKTHRASVAGSLPENVVTVLRTAYNTRRRQGVLYS